MAEKRTITDGERLQLLGLFVLHRQAYLEQQRIEAAVGALVGERDEGMGYYGLATDELSMQHPSVDNLLKRLNIEVGPPPEPAPSDPVREGYITAHEAGGHAKYGNAIEGCPLCEATP